MLDFEIFWGRCAGVETPASLRNNCPPRSAEEDSKYKYKNKSKGKDNSNDNRRSFDSNRCAILAQDDSKNKCKNKSKGNRNMQPCRYVVSHISEAGFFDFAQDTPWATRIHWLKVCDLLTPLRG